MMDFTLENKYKNNNFHLTSKFKDIALNNNNNFCIMYNKLNDKNNSLLFNNIDNYSKLSKLFNPYDNSPNQSFILREFYYIYIVQLFRKIYNQETNKINIYRLKNTYKFLKEHPIINSYDYKVLTAHEESIQLNFIISTSITTFFFSILPGIALSKNKMSYNTYILLSFLNFNSIIYLIYSKSKKTEKFLEVNYKNKYFFEFDKLIQNSKYNII